MTKETFSNLRAGDVLLFPSGLLRTVIEGPIDLVKKRGPWTPSVTLMKFNRSKYSRALTVRFFSDVPKGTRVLSRIRSLCLKAELRRIRDIGFDPRTEMMREAKQDLEYSKRVGWKICDKLKRFAKGKL